eukprot:scaffold24565_cov27-Tisochrysis_lutea.AAC.1
MGYVSHSPKRSLIARVLDGSTLPPIQQLGAQNLDTPTRITEWHDPSIATKHGAQHEPVDRLRPCPICTLGAPGILSKYLPRSP